MPISPPNASQPQWNNELFKSLSHKGALVKKNANQAVADITDTILTWEEEEFDTSGIHSNTTNNQRLIVPEGITRVILRAGVKWDTFTTGTRTVFIEKNDGAFLGMPEVTLPAASGRAVINLTSPVVQVTGEDYFTVVVSQSSGTSVDVVSNDRTWFEMQIIG